MDIISTGLFDVQDNNSVLKNYFFVNMKGVGFLFVVGFQFCKQLLISERILQPPFVPSGHDKEIQVLCVAFDISATVNFINIEMYHFNSENPHEVISVCQSFIIVCLILHKRVALIKW